MFRLLRPGLLLVLILCDGVLGWLNYHAGDDVQLVALGLLVFGFGLTFWRPRQVGMIVPLLWLAVPVSSVLGYMTNHHPGLIKPHPPYETLVALIPTVLGALAGLTARWAGARATTD